MDWPSYLLLICRRKSTFYYIFLIFLLLLQEVIGHLLPDYVIELGCCCCWWHLYCHYQQFKVKSNFYLQIVTEEIRQRDLMIDDEEEDFLDECTVNPTGIQNIG